MANNRSYCLWKLHYMRRYLWVLLFAQLLHLSGLAHPDTSEINLLKSIATEQNDTTRIHHLAQYGQLLINRAQPDSAIHIANRVFRESEQRQYMRGKLNALILRTSAYYQKNHFEQSIQAATQAAALCTGPFKNRLPGLYHHIGTNFLSTGNYTAAGRYFFKAIEVVHQLNDTSFELPASYLSLYLVWDAFGDYEKALHYVNEAEKRSQKPSYRHYLADVYNLKGILLMDSDPEAAYTYLLRSVELSTAIQGNLTKYYCYGSLIDYHLKHKDTLAAKSYLKQWDQFLQQPIDDAKRCMYYLYTGRIKHMIKDFSESETLIRKGFELAVKIDNPYYLGGAYQDLSSFYSATGNYAKAFEFRKTSDSIKAAYANETRMKELTFLEQEHQLALKEKMMAQQKLEAASIKKAMARQSAIIIALLVLAGSIIAFFWVYRKHSKRKLQLRQEQLKTRTKDREAEIMQAIIYSEEAERRRIAMELHDGINSKLSITRLNFSSFGKKYDIAHDAQFREALKLLDDTVHEVRNTSHSLLPDILLKGGLVEALHIYCRRNLPPEQVDFQSYGSSRSLSPHAEKTIFRIVQIILETSLRDQNQYRYLLQLNWYEQELFITIDNNSNILIVDDDRLPAGFWQQLQHRAQAIDGKLEIDRQAKIVNTISLEFPIQATDG